MYYGNEYFYRIFRPPFFVENCPILTFWIFFYKKNIVTINFKGPKFILDHYGKD